eukprot:749359-Hanusia_phi.AAC.5
MAGMERMEREEMLRKRSEEADMRRTEALKMAQSVVMQQEAKLLSSPAANRSQGSRRGHDSASSSPAKSSTQYSTPTKKKHLEDDDYDEQAYEDEVEDAAFGNEDEVMDDLDSGGAMGAAESGWRSRAQQASRREGEDEGHVATPQMGSEATIRLVLEGEAESVGGGGWRGEPMHARAAGSVDVLGEAQPRARRVLDKEFEAQRKSQGASEFFVPGF